MVQDRGTTIPLRDISRRGEGESSSDVVPPSSFRARASGILENIDPFFRIGVAGPCWTVLGLKKHPLHNPKQNSRRALLLLCDIMEWEHFFFTFIIRGRRDLAMVWLFFSLFFSPLRLFPPCEGSVLEVHQALFCRCAQQTRRNYDVLVHANSQLT